MAAAPLPPLNPAAITVVLPTHPHVAKRSTGGGETRIRLSNVRVAARLSLSFEAIDTADLQPFVAHWIGCRGTAREFAISAANLGAIAARGQAQLLSTTWKYAGPPKCVDICGGRDQRLLHTLEIELVSQPRRIAQYLDPANPLNSLPRLSSVNLPGAAL